MHKHKSKKKIGKRGFKRPVSQLDILALSPQRRAFGFFLLPIFRED